MKQTLYRTTKPIEALGITIPKNSFVVLKHMSGGDYGYFKFLGLFSGLTKLIHLEDVIFDSYSNINQH